MDSPGQVYLGIQAASSLLPVPAHFSHLWVASCEQFCSLALFSFYNALLTRSLLLSLRLFLLLLPHLGGVAAFFNPQLRSLTPCLAASPSHFIQHLRFPIVYTVNNSIIHLHSVNIHCREKGELFLNERWLLFLTVNSISAPPTMRASTLSAGLVPAVVLLLASIPTTVAQLAVHRLAVEDYRHNGDAGHFQGLAPRAANYGEPSDYGYYPPPYGEETTSATTTTKSGACEYTTLLSAYLCS